MKERTIRNYFTFYQENLSSYTRNGILIKEVPLLELSDVRNGQLALQRGWKQSCEDSGQSKEEDPYNPPNAP